MKNMKYSLQIKSKKTINRLLSKLIDINVDTLDIAFTILDHEKKDFLNDAINAGVHVIVNSIFEKIFPDPQAREALRELHKWTAISALVERSQCVYKQDFITLDRHQEFYYFFMNHSLPAAFASFDSFPVYQEISTQQLPENIQEAIKRDTTK